MAAGEIIIIIATLNGDQPVGKNIAEILSCAASLVTPHNKRAAGESSDSEGHKDDYADRENEADKEILDALKAICTNPEGQHVRANDLAEATGIDIDDVHAALQRLIRNKTVEEYKRGRGTYFKLAATE